MSRTVSLSPTARDDLLESDAYVAADRGAAEADALIDRLEARIRSLSDLEERGRFPPELDRVGVRTFRELIESPYRVVYEARPDAVVVHAVLDGRRDLQTLLVRRVLR